MDEQTFTMTEAQWQQINSALLAAIGIASVHAKDMQPTMLAASNLMDEIAGTFYGDDDETD